MILKDRKTGWVLLAVTIELLFVFLLIVIIKKRYLLNSAWFSSKFYVFQFATFYQIGYSQLRAHDSGARLIRYKSRRKISMMRLGQAVVLAFYMTCILQFFSVCGIISGTHLDASNDAIYILNTCARFFLGLIILAELYLIFFESRFRVLRSFPGLISFAILAMELLVIVPQINQFSPINIHIMFSWIFNGNLLVSYIALTIVIVALFTYILRTENTKDIDL